MNVHAVLVCMMRVAPHHCIVADNAAGRMVKRSQHRIARLVAYIQLRAQARNLIRKHKARVDALQPVYFCAPAHRAHRGVGVCQRKVPALAEHHIEVQRF